MPVPYQIYSNFLFAKAGGQGVPLSGTFELTARCNLDCRMCYIHKRSNDAAALRRERSADEWLALARDCQKAGTLLLLALGGGTTEALYLSSGLGWGVGAAVYALSSFLCGCREWWNARA